jgi:hypothetical protein
MKKNLIISKRKIVRGLAAFLVIGFLILLTSPLWLANLNNPSFNSYAPSSDLEVEFSESYAKNADINTGILIRVTAFYKNEFESQMGKFVEFEVYNETNEPVIFKNIGFGIRIFSPDETSVAWQEIKLLYSPEMVPKIIDSNTTSFNPNIYNSFVVLYSDFDVELPKNIRLYISGVGQITNKDYIAFVDLARE